ASEDVVQEADEDHGDDERAEGHRTDVDAGELPTHAAVRDVAYGYGVPAPDAEREVLEDDPDAESEQHLIQLRRLEDEADRRPVDDRTDDEERRRNEQDREQRVEPEAHEELVREEGPDHEELAVSEVD